MTNPDDLIHAYSSPGILIDANLLLLLLIGERDPSRITNFKRTSKYSKEDYEFLKMFLQPFHHVFTTPNILTEVDNLLSKELREVCFSHFFKIIQGADERYIASLDTMQQAGVNRLGLSDIGIVSVAKCGCLVITDDLDLYLHLAACGIPVANFNHMRSWI